MVVCLKVDKSKAEAAKEFLKKNNWLDYSFIIGKGRKYLLFPIKSKAKLEDLEKFGSIENRSLEKRKVVPSGSLKDLLKGVIPAEFIDKVVRSYDVIGDIAILEVPEELEKFEKTIAWTLLRTRKNIKAVYKKEGKVKGKYRVRALKHLEGEKRTEAIHVESGVRIKLDIDKVYFSPRLGQERLRVANKIKKKEDVLVMFAGVGPYALVIAKKHHSVKITGVEINPTAVKYFKENVKLNKIPKGQITIVKGDCLKEVPKLRKKFDRIIMPLPESAWDFLELAFKKVRENGTIHLYTFDDPNNFKDLGEKIKGFAKKAGKEVKKINLVVCGPFAPNVERLCLDISVK